MQTDAMQAILVREVGRFELVELAVPELGPGEALVRVSVTGLCRTDLKLIRHGHRDLELPRVPGEEVVGEIVALEPAAAPAVSPHQAGAGFATGDRVYVYPGLWCGICPSCLRGAENLCRGTQINLGLAGSSHAMEEQLFPRNRRQQLL